MTRDPITRSPFTENPLQVPARPFEYQINNRHKTALKRVRKESSERDVVKAKQIVNMSLEILYYQE